MRHGSDRRGAAGAHLSSASRASFASGSTLMLMISPPHALYILLSARVENCGPSIHTMHLSVCSLTSRPSLSSATFTRSSKKRTSLFAKGSPNCACATTERPSKKLAGRTPFVRSMICDGRTKSPGRISSRREPTAEKATTSRTPSDLSAAMLARDGTEEGEMEWPTPCRAMKATCVPPAPWAMVMGELGLPQGCRGKFLSVRRSV